MKAVRKTLASFLVMLLVPMIVGLTVAQAVHSFLREPGAISSAVRNSGLYDRAQATLSDYLVTTLAADLPSLPVTAAEVTNLIDQVLPASELASIGDQLMSGMQDWVVTGGPIRADLVVDLTGPRERFLTGFTDLIEVKFAALPVCNSQQAQQMLAGELADGFPPCRTEDAQLNRRLIEEALAPLDLAEIVPVRIDLGAELAEIQGDTQAETQEMMTELGMGGLSLPTRLSTFTSLGFAFLPVAWGVAGFFLLLLALLNLDRWYTPFVWMGIPLLVGGGIAFVMSLIAQFGSSALVRIVVPTDANGEMLLPLTESLLGLVGIVLRNVSFPVLLLGLGGVAVTVAGALLDRPNEPGAETPADKASTAG